MKTETYIIAILLVAGLPSSRAQDTWTQKADFGGTARRGAVGFSIGNKGYIGTGDDSVAVCNDFWEFDPSTNAWTQKADFGGIARGFAVGFAIDGKGYIGTGNADSFYNRPTVDFWEYDPAGNSWTRKADFKGSPRSTAIGFSIGDKGYIGTGFNDNYDFKADFWEYDPSADSWVQKSDFAGAKRSQAIGFSIGDKGYIGTGLQGVYRRVKDFWEYDPSTNAWTQKADFAGTGRQAAVGLSVGGKGYIGTGQDTNYIYNDFWEYDPISNVWTQKADFGGIERVSGIAFSVGSKGYVGCGLSNQIEKDFWEYTPDDSGGSGACEQPPSGLVSWWSGDKTADDVQGTNPGHLEGGASFAKGMVGTGFLFDGINDGVKIPNSSSLSQRRITLDAWVYPTGKAGTNRHIISKDNDSQTREYILAATFLDKFTANIWLPGGMYVEALGTTSIQLNTWYHVAMTHDGTKLKLYVNGVLETASDAVGDIVPTTNPVGIGGNVASVFFQGIIDEAQIYDRALSDAEILAIYQAGADGQCKPDIFVASINPSYEVLGRGYTISTSILIQDGNGISIPDANVQLGTILPSGSSLSYLLKTNNTGQADLSFATHEVGLYKFKVQKVSHPARNYNSSLNIETTDTLVIP